MDTPKEISQYAKEHGFAGISYTGTTYDGVIVYGEQYISSGPTGFPCLLLRHKDGSLSSICGCESFRLLDRIVRDDIRIFDRSQFARKYNRHLITEQFNDGCPQEFLFFWGHTERSESPTKASLSQWYPCSFIDDGITYNCAEQFMMAEKARIFGDYEIRQQIISQSNPHIIKKLGREVRNFDPDKWTQVNMEIVAEGNYRKFSQNQQLLEFLKSTENKILVEASPYDTIWGIGLKSDNPNATNPNMWNGTNKLGFTLMEIRDMLNR